MRSRKVQYRVSPALVALAVLVVCGLCFPPQSKAFAPHPPGNKKNDMKRQVELLEEQWRTAQLAGDAATMDKLLSDDYIGISMTGQVLTKAQQLERVRTHQITLKKFDLSDMKVKLIGSIAIVTSRADVEGVNENQAVQGTFRYTRVYQRLPSGMWKITSFEATRAQRPGGGNRSLGTPEPADRPAPSNFSATSSPR